MNIKINIGLLFLMLSIVLISCNNQTKQVEFDYGEIENQQYINKFFNIDITLPADWYYFSEEANSRLVKNSDQLIAGSNKSLQQTLDASKISTAILLTASRYGSDIPDSTFNPNLMLVAENLNNSKHIKSSSDYLHITRKALDQDAVAKTYPYNSYRIKEINNTSFSSMRVINKINDVQSYTQDYYVTISHSFALTFILTYQSAFEQKQLEQSLNSLKPLTSTTE